MGEFFYRYIRFWTKLILPFFFRPFIVEGKSKVPTEAPYIVVTNHQAAFMDAMIIGGILPANISYFTRADVFTPLFDRILRSLHMLPIYRLRDGYGSLRRNEDTFESAKQRLKDGGRLVIFPEAAHDPRHHLRPISKGAARLALQTQGTMNKPLYIVPCGLNYFHHDKPGHPMIISFGDPIAIKNHLQAYHAHPARAIRLLQSDMGDAIKAQLMIPDEPENYPQLRASLRTIEQVKSLSEAKKIVADYKTSPSNKVETKLTNLWKSLLTIPLFPVRLLMSILIRRINNPIFDLSIKMAFGVVIYPIYAILVFLIVGLVAGWFYGLVALIIVIMSCMLF